VGGDSQGVSERPAYTALKNWFCRKRSISGLGLAGIGYFFLRLANPAAVPSIMLTVPDHYYHPA